ncbi:hypothetical protein EXIGLDRAFT_716595 [Exidia glandulosa HHB12029]|uniref:F-box domain-containing protein n=1 Tax=Exidia glandulosa HHB12029 TaxID=1314781 RepID=A0A165IW72_EXIGL|nr:hypothetical protein EXIGLDRAFT_716595 [Exidia glandulosa HHB12029]
MPKYGALAHLLAAFPAITSLTLDLCCMGGEACGSALLRHDTLRSLHIYEPEGFACDPPLAMAYSFPQLRYAKFELQTPDDTDEVCIEGPMQLLINGLSTLHSLEFDVEIDMAKLLPALRNMPFLESLVCDRGHPDEGFCAALASPSYTGWLCPRLKLVTLRMELAELQECTDAISARNDAQTAGADIARVERLTSLSPEGVVEDVIKFV